MQAEGIATSAISAFESTFNSLVGGNTGLIPESTISPAPDLAKSESFTATPNTGLLSETVVLKLNGGLGTGMGLDKAKSLLKVKGEDTFLDLTAKQIMAMREEYKMKVKFMLMNSFSTSEDTLNFFKENYPSLAGEDGLEMMQNKVPKIDATTFEVSFVMYKQTCICIFFIRLMLIVNSFHFLFLFPYSLLHALRILITNGVHLVTVTCTLHLKVLVVLIIF